MKSKKSEEIYDGITDVREDIVDRAREPEGKKRRLWWPAAVAVVLVVVLVSGIVLWPRGGAGDPMAADPAESDSDVLNLPASDPAASGDTADFAAYALAMAEYPEMVPYPNESDYQAASGDTDYDSYYEAYGKWREDKRSFTAVEVDRFAELKNFLSVSTAEFLTGAETDNRVYSPVNVYMALAMLAETASGNSREQILNLLEVDSIETLRSQASAVWKNCYCDDGAVTSILASSLWMNQDVEFTQDTIDTLAETYYASAFQGEMGSAAFNAALQSWINEQTGGLLQEQASGLEMKPETILALVTTICFQARWYSEFQPSQTDQGIFHAANEDLTCDFMHQQTIGSDYYWGEKFSAVAESLDDAGNMWFLLPDEGVTADELLSDEEVMEFLFLRSVSEWENQKYVLVNLAVPKFDVSSDLELTSGLKDLGVTDVFDGMRSDFTPLTSQSEGIYVSKVQHAARVTIDEEGCTAAAYTVMTKDGAGMPEDEVDFVLDRPFLFAITNNQGIPLFVGVVNQPVS